MKPFMDKDFLLTTPTARTLYHEAAEHMPIYDYHCHLSPKEIAENIQFRNITHLMLGGDHYKWRAMLSFGIDEELIRGNAPDYDKFLAYARMMPYAIGNPLYHWTHLELQRVFGINQLLDEHSAPAIWEQANAMLATEEFRARRLIEKFDVRLVCTTDDPVDSLEYHRQLAEDESFSVKVLPAFRPDKAIHLERRGFAEYIVSLSAAAQMSIHGVDDVIAALEKRVEFFHQNGARVSDHALDCVPYAQLDPAKAEEAFKTAMKGEIPSQEAAEHYKTALLVALGGMYARRGWVQQYHMNAMRNNNTRIFAQYGPDVGFDSVSDAPVAHKLSRLLDAQEREGALPKTILYSLNPSDNYVIGTMLGNFQQGGVPGKIQMGSGWWFCDQRDGMIDQMKALANLGLLSRFVGMLTDSRSFISYPRHEYFRRILCNLLGEWVENGEYPCDMGRLKEIVRGISYENAVRYFGIKL